MCASIGQGRFSHRIVGVGIRACVITAFVSLAGLDASTAEAQALPTPSGDANDSADPLLRSQLPPIGGMIGELRMDGERLPVDLAATLFHPASFNSWADRSMPPWPEREFWWAATEFWHWPLYFDDVPLESYGQTSHPLLQPGLSGAHFFGDIILMPGKMLADLPLRRISQLGEYRPGSCAPPMRSTLRLELDPAIRR